MQVPAGLRRWAREPGGAAWLERLPRLVAECADAWDLEVDPPFAPATIAWVAPVRRADGTAAALKLSFPEAESEHEGAALAWWRGDGAVRLLESDPARRALLLERCSPGTALVAEAGDDEAGDVVVELLSRLWRAPARDHPFASLAERAAAWADELERRPASFERALLIEAAATLRELATSQGELVVLHQDLHAGNVLRAAREPGWLAIDPKPLAGERAFDLASLIRDRRPELARDPHAARRVRRRIDRLSSALELDRERVRGWALGQTLAWAWSRAGWDPDLVQCARWIAAA